MEKIAVLFPSSDEFFVMPSLRWVAEYYACMRSEVFEPVLFWQRGFMDFGELALALLTSSGRKRPSARI